MKLTFTEIKPYLWEIHPEEGMNMKVPAYIYATKEMLEHAAKDRSLRQLVNVAGLPGILKFAIVMPDVHEGYGFPIGAVAAIDFDEGIISPGGIGYDINCGVRLLKSELSHQDIKDRIPEICKEFYRMIPSGVGKSGGLKLSDSTMKDMLANGVRWAVGQGYATEDDLENIESNGSLSDANPDFVLQNAIGRGHDQLGTMGAGNHFVEICRVDKVFDEEAAKIFGLYENQIVVQIHTGSRGLGHQVATDYIKKMIPKMKDFGIELPDRELCYAPFSSKLGQEYFAAMCAAANFAWTNRQLITHEIREAWYNVLGKSGGEISILYDVAHNIAKVEEHTIEGKKKKVIVHRKGATRAFPKGHPEIPEKYRSVGQPVLIPGSMGTASYVLVGLPENMENTFGSTCHGAGRMLSRTAALKRIHGKDLFDELTNMGISVQTGSYKGLAEEAPDAYKDIESVVNVTEEAGIAKRVVRLKPLAVVKG